MKKISKYRVMHLRMKSQMRWLVTSLFVTVILLSTLLNKDFATNLIWPPKAIAKGCLQSVGNSGLVVSVCGAM